MVLTRLLAVAVFGFGLMLGVGSLAEITIALRPSLLPQDAVPIPFMAAHQTSWALRGWMIASNIINFGCAIAFLISSVAIFRNHARGWRHLRVAATVMGGVALMGLPVCLHYLLPIETGPTKSASLIMLICVIGAATGLATMCLILVGLASRALRPGPAP